MIKVLQFSIVIPIFVLVILTYLPTHYQTATAQFSPDEYSIFAGYKPVMDCCYRYFTFGDTVKLSGNFYATSSNGIQALNDVLVDVTMHRPDGTTVPILKDYVPKTPGSFTAQIPINNTFPIGEYYFDLSAHKKDQTSEPEENQSPFYVVRSKQFVIPADGREFNVTVVSIEYEVSDVKFDKDSKSLTVYLQGIPTKYAADDFSQSKDMVELTVEKPLISAPFYVAEGNQTHPIYGGFGETDKEYFVPIGTNGSQENATITLIGTYAVPEFPLATQVLLMGIISLMAFYKINASVRPPNYS